MFTWRLAAKEWVLGVARKEEVRTFVVRLGITYGWSHGGMIGELGDSAREHGAARHAVPPEAENNSLALVHLDDLGGLHGWCWNESW